jgi:hypothetical protein
MRYLILLALLTSSCSTIDVKRTRPEGPTISPKRAAEIAIKAAHDTASQEEKQALDAYLKTKR